jgi:hypothetical protein
MHARIDQLLSLRDGEPVDAEVRLHVQHCTQCLAEAALVAKTRARLQELPMFAPPADAWSRIATQAQAPQNKRHSLRIAAGLLAIFVGVAAFIVIRDNAEGPQFVATPMVEERAPAADGEMQRLIAQSRELDELLQYLPDRPHVERVSLAATVDSIEERIQVLDWQLAYGSDAGLDQRQAHRLWSERVELMDSLVKVRYAETAPMSF